MNRSYEDLNVWVRSKKLAVDIYKASKNFPREELYGLTSQMRRCAVSVPSNIAEGCERNNRKEFIQFLHIASGSLGELHTQLLIAQEIGFIDQVSCHKLSQESREIGKMLNGLINSLKKESPKLATGN